MAEEPAASNLNDSSNRSARTASASQIRTFHRVELWRMEIDRMPGSRWRRLGCVIVTDKKKALRFRSALKVLAIPRAVLEPESRYFNRRAESMNTHVAAGFEIQFHFFRDRCPSQAKFLAPGICPSFVHLNKIDENDC
ncbi:MAG TPA: hypothetical protein VF778_03140 [Xanthobacteraceae bacterium]